MDSLAQRLAGRTVLITGASGFLGSSIVRELAAVDCTIRRLSRRAQPITVDTTARIEDIVGDVREPRTWAEAMADVDVVLHLAAQTSARTANDEPAADLAANVQPMLHLLAACRAAGTRPTVVAAGTATQVGLTTNDAPIDESHPDHPITIYDLHKWMAERYLETFTTTGIMRAATLRLTNVYGPGPAGSSNDRGFLNAMVKRALAGEPLTLYGKGQFVRDYVFVEDAARAFLAAAASIDSVQGQHFLVGSGRGTAIAEALNLVADRAARVTGRKVPVVSVEPPAGTMPIESRNFVADTRRLRDATGWNARVSLEEGIDRTIESS